MAIVKFSVLLVFAVCSISANANGCDEKLLPPGETRPFKSNNRTYKILLSSEVEGLETQTGENGKTYMALSETANFASFCVYKREQKKSHTQYIFKLMNTNRTIAFENDITKTKLVVEELKNLNKSHYIFNEGLVTMTSWEYRPIELRRFSTLDFSRVWEIVNDTLVHSAKSSDLCNRLFKLK